MQRVQCEDHELLREAVVAVLLLVQNHYLHHNQLKEGEKNSCADFVTFKKIFKLKTSDLQIKGKTENEACVLRPQIGFHFQVLPFHFLLLILNNYGII